MGSRSSFLGMAASAIAAGVLCSNSVILPAQAETFLEATDKIIPAEKTYNFEGTQGQQVTVVLNSDDFDPVLSLLDSQGNEVAVNDDFGGSLNSTIILTLPANDTYTVLARSYSGEGGDFDLVIRTSTDFEIAFARGQDLAQQEKYEAAIAAYTEAIGFNPNQPSAYLGRAEAYLGQVSLSQGDALNSPADIPVDIRTAIINDFESAADLIEATGPQDWADELRDQANFLRNVETQGKPDVQPEMEPGSGQSN